LLADFKSNQYPSNSIFVDLEKGATRHMQIDLVKSKMTQDSIVVRESFKDYSKAVDKESSKQSSGLTKYSSNNSISTCEGKKDKDLIFKKGTNVDDEEYLGFEQPVNRQEVQEDSDDDGYFKDAKTVLPEDLEAIKKIGSGTFAKVYLCKSRISGQTYALKVIDKSILKNKSLVKYAVTERNILMKVKSDFVVSLKLSFQTKTH
jgi:hypothetical protein